MRFPGIQKSLSTSGKTPVNFHDCPLKNVLDALFNIPTHMLFNSNLFEANRIRHYSIWIIDVVWKLPLAMKDLLIVQNLSAFIYFLYSWKTNYKGLSLSVKNFMPYNKISIQRVPPVVFSSSISTWTTGPHVMKLRSHY